MTTRALVLADRSASDCEPVAGDLLPALLPIAGKPVIQHCIEDLWEAGVREVMVAVPPGDPAIRWGGPASRRSHRFWSHGATCCGDAAPVSSSKALPA